MNKTVLAAIGVCIITIVSLGSELWALLIIGGHWGFWGVFLALLLFPGTICLVPWYMLFVNGYWQLFLFTYGGFLLGGFLFSIGDDGSDQCKEDLNPAYNIKIDEIESQKYSESISNNNEAIEIGQTSVDD